MKSKVPFWQRQARWYRRELLRIAQARMLNGLELREAAEESLAKGSAREVVARDRMYSR